MQQKIHIDELINASLKSEELPGPGQDFTDKVMSSLTAEPVRLISYRPLLSKKILVSISCCVAIIIALFLLIPPAPTQSPFYTTFFNSLPDHFRNISINIEIPSILSYIVPCTFLMLFLQAIIINKFIRKTH